MLAFPHTPASHFENELQLRQGTLSLIALGTHGLQVVQSITASLRHRENMILRHQQISTFGGEVIQIEMWRLLN
jgi:hypothetical protein